jgi:hypothetical protein
MLTYLVVFVVAVFLIRIPIFLFGVLFRFGKPLSLVGFGAFLGVSLTAGAPEPSLFNQEPLHQSSGSKIQVDTAPIELVEVASRIAHEVEGEVREILSEVDWKEILGGTTLKR